MINVLLVCGGGSSEHEISLKSAQHIFKVLKDIPEFNTYYMCIEKNSDRVDLEGRKCELRKSGILIREDLKDPINLHYVIPCIHGYPGETGDIQSLFDMMNLPYLGTGPEASKICFNKVSTKLWLDGIGLANSPYIFLVNQTEDCLLAAKQFFAKNPDVFVKASNQGSSIGCYHVTQEEQLSATIKDAFKYSEYVLIEKTMKARELEVAVYEYQGKLHAVGPGEIKLSSDFYSFEEKYSESSKASVSFNVSDLSLTLKNEMHAMAKMAFENLKLKDLARIDFFLTAENELFINEINTFPGHTEISLFPKLLEASGVSYKEYIQDRILTNKRSS